MKHGESELNHVFWKTCSQLGSLSVFYSSMSHGLPQGVTKSLMEAEEVGEALYKDGTFADLLTEDEYHSMMREDRKQLFQKGKDDAKGMLDAVAVVFAHGVLDACVYGYLEVLSLSTPESFKSYTEKKQVCLSEVESKSYDQLHEEKLTTFMEGTVERQSLMCKLDKLHEIAQPKNTQLNPYHKYDRERLDRFDKARHDIVHGNSWTSYSIKFETEFYYWYLLNSYFVRVVAKKTGLKLSQEGREKHFIGL